MSRKITTFLVDDDIDDQEIFSIVMQEAYEHAQCIFANDGVLALEKMNDTSFTPDIIFMDINMPRMNGMDCLAAIKKDPRLGHIPAYMYSTSAENEIVEQCLKLGAVGCIKKHSNTDEIKKEFHKIIANLPGL